MIRLTCILFLLIPLSSFAQLTKELKLETGYSFYRYQLVQVEPGPNWMGYNLPDNTNGLELNIIYGLRLKSVLFTGLGVGYVNYKGINGYTYFGDMACQPFKTKIKPLLGIRFGANHINNQYPKGSTTALLEFNYGLSFSISKLRISVNSGFAATQQVYFVPLRLGVILAH